MTRFDPPLVMAQAVMSGASSPQLRASGSGLGELDAPEGAGLFDPSLHPFPSTPRSPASTALAASLAASHYEMVTTKQFSPLASAMSQQLLEFNNLEHQLKTNGHQSGLSLNQLQHQATTHTMAATAALPHPHLAPHTSGPSAATLAALVEDLGNGDGADLPAMYSQRLWLQQPREVNIVFGRDVIQVPLKVENSNNEYVNLVLSHREFDVMAVHIPKYDEMPPTELLDEITRNLKEQLEKQKSRRNAFPLSNQLGEFPDSNATFQARIMELEYELSRLNTKLTAARALQTTLTDENTLLRSNIQDLEQRCVENETLKMQNEALRDQSVVAFSQNGKLKQLLTATTQELKTLSRQVQSLRTQVHFEKSEIAMQVDHSMNALIANVRDREHVLQESYLEEKKERQLIAEKYYEISGRIRVFCRLRPVTRSLHKAVSSALLRPKPNALLVGRSGKEFSFDQVFGPENSQADVYAQMEPVVISFVDGYNACIMAYGQTGSGKTFTMMGGSGEFQGMIPRALQQVFSVVNARQLTYKDTLSVSMVEIYNDQILDLLTESESGGKIKNESDITLRPVTLWEHVNAVLAEGNANRNIASTSMNLESSRSHALVFLNLESQHRETMEIRKSTLCLVDLAGSERISRSQVEGDRLKETQHINKSLSALGDVMHALQHKAKHVPYRNSKLTYMLREMLSGHAKTLMMLQLSPEDDDIEETICSLQFGARVSQIQMGAVKTSIESGAIFKLKEENRMLEKRIAELEEQSSAWKFERRSTLDDLQDARDRNQKLQAQLGQQHDDMTQLQEKLEAVSVISAVSESPPRSPLEQDPSESTTLLSRTYSANSARSMRSVASTSSAPATAPGTPGTSRYGEPSAAARPTRTGGLGSSGSTRANSSRPLPRSVPKDTASTTPPPAPTSTDRLARRKSLTTLGSQSAATILTARERLARAANDPDAQSNRRATLGAISTSSTQSNPNAAAPTPASSRVRQALAKDPEVQSNRRASLGAVGTGRSQPNLNAATPTPANSRARTPAAPSTPPTPATQAGSSSTRPAPMRRINSLSTPKSTPASAAASPSRTGSSLRPPSSLEQSAPRSSSTLRTPSTLEQRRALATSRASPSTSRSAPSATRTRPTGTPTSSATRTETSRRSPSTFAGA